jgi:hypothetical protein
MDLLGALPEYNTMNKLNSALKEGVEESDSEDEADETPKETKKEQKVKAKDSDDESVDIESMTAKAMYEFGKSKGVKFTSTKKADMIAKLQEEGFGTDAKPAKKAKKEEVEEDEADVDYSEMTTKELYLLCKKNGIKVEQKKPAKYYITKLEAAAEPEEDEEWDEEEADEAPKASKKAKTKAKEEPEDDDEWDI